MYATNISAGTKKNGQEAAYECERTAGQRLVRCGRSTAVPISDLQGAQENSERETQDRRAGTKKNGQEAAYGCDRTACRRPVRCGRSTAVPTHLSGDFDVFRRFFED